MWPKTIVSDPQSLVLAVDRACRKKVVPDPFASYSVNVSNRIPSSNEYDFLPVQNQGADLHAATQALEVVYKLIIAGERFSQVIIKLNSESIDKVFSAYIWKWTDKGFRNWRRQPVVPGRMPKYLDEKVRLLERPYGMQFTFCLVPRGEMRKNIDLQGRVEAGCAFCGLCSGYFSWRRYERMRLSGRIWETQV